MRLQLAETFPIAIPADALAQLKLLHKRKAQPGEFVRVGVKGGGCSGFEYVIRFDSVRRETDLAIELDELLLVCDPKSAEFLENSTLVYTGNLLGGGFKFENPNAARSCGCGTSFMPK